MKKLFIFQGINKSNIAESGKETLGEKKIKDKLKML